MKKAIRFAGFIGSFILVGLLLLIAVSCVIYTPEYIYRCIVNQDGKTTDYLFFPERIIERSAMPYQYGYKLDDSFNELDIQYTVKGELKNLPLDTLAQSTGTTSLLVIQNDLLVYEEYFNGYNADSINTSFSTVKSIVSLLVGIAIDDGYIQSETQPISDFIPELNGTEFMNITIRELLTMRSKISYKEGGLWFGDDARTYYYPDLRWLVLNRMSVDKAYNGQFHYNNYHPLLLGMILERSTGVSVSRYLQDKIWKKVGAQYDASWSLDSYKSGFEKMESGLNFRSIDFAKIGSMLLHRGSWNGQTLVSGDWLDRSVIASEPMDASGIGYQYMWYSFENEQGGHDYFAHGKHGQYLYISPENNTVIVRTGTEEGAIDMWIAALYQMAVYAGTRRIDS